MDPLSCNYDPNANYNIPSLCCYPGNCNDRDITLVCPDISGGTAFHLFPNPAHDGITLQFSAGTNNAVRYTVYDAYGLIAIDKDLGTLTGSVTEQVDISGLQEGLYLVRVFEGNNIESATFMKQ
jgi:hypothetical protein